MGRGKKDFYPDYLIEITFIIFLVLEITTILALIHPQAIGRRIDFSAAYRPMPEWYFLWLYQLVRYFPGKWTFVGAVVLPFSAALAFILIPFIDKGKRGRLKAVLLGLIFLLSFIIFTLIPVYNP